MQKVYLKPMTDEMYHEYFKKYQNDIDLYLDKTKYYDYVYDKDNVDKYIKKQRSLNRICFAIMLDEHMAGEIKLYNFVIGKSVTLGISMKNDYYKNKGLGVQAEKLIKDYAFNILGVETMFADTIITNTRSQHVLEKVGFKLIKEDENYKYYKLDKNN